MPRVNNVHERIKDEITNNNRPKGWTSAELGLAIGVRTGSLRYVCRQLVEEGILIIKEIENPKKGECRIRYFRPLENGEDVYGIGMANKINAHNIFSRPHCGGRG